MYTTIKSVGSSMASWQKAAHSFDFKNGLLRSEASDELVSEAGDYLMME